MSDRRGVDRNAGQDVVPEFDVVLWGYDRGQVHRCLEDLTARLEAALSGLDSVEMLRTQLCQTQTELDQLRLSIDREPSWSHRLAEIMEEAEQLRARAEQDADEVRARGYRRGRRPVPSAE